MHHRYGVVISYFVCKNVHIQIKLCFKNAYIMHYIYFCNRLHWKSVRSDTLSLKIKIITVMMWLFHISFELSHCISLKCQMPVGRIYQHPWISLMWLENDMRVPGPCITNVIATCRKNFSQRESSFLWKLRYDWLKFLRRVAKTLVIQGPG